MSMAFRIRVYRNGDITEAFKTYHDLMEQMDGYPVLDEEDYPNGNLKRPWKNISAAAWAVLDEYELPDGWESEVFSWFWHHCRSTPSRTVTTQAVTQKRTTFGQRSMPWAMSRSKSETN